MASTFTELAIDCADRRSQAAFWCAVLGYEVRGEDEEIVTIGPPGVPESHQRPGPPVLTFAQVPEGKVVKNRLHLDLTPADRDQAAEVERLLGLGASRADIGQGDQPWVVLTDPEGNEFCVLGAHP